MMAGDSAIQNLNQPPLQGRMQIPRQPGRQFALGAAPLQQPPLQPAQSGPQGKSGGLPQPLQGGGLPVFGGFTQPPQSVGTPVFGMGRFGQFPAAYQPAQYQPAIFQPPQLAPIIRPAAAPSSGLPGGPPGGVDPDAWRFESTGG